MVCVSFSAITPDTLARKTTRKMALRLLPRFSRLWLYTLYVGLLCLVICLKLARLLTMSSATVTGIFRLLFFPGLPSYQSESRWRDISLGVWNGYVHTKRFPLLISWNSLFSLVFLVSIHVRDSGSDDALDRRTRLLSPAAELRWLIQSFFFFFSIFAPPNQVVWVYWMDAIRLCVGLIFTWFVVLVQGFYFFGCSFIWLRLENGRLCTYILLDIRIAAFCSIWPMSIPA